MTGAAMSMRLHRGAWKIGLVLVAGLVASACAAADTAGQQEASKGGGTHVKFTLNYLPGGAQAGFMYGKSLGIFRKAGIDLKIVPGSGSLTTVEQVATGKADIAYADAPTVFSVAARGGAVTVIAPILQVNGFAIIALKKSGISSVKDLPGKRLGVITGLAPTVLLPAVLKANGVQPNSVHMVHIQIASQLGALLQHKVDALVAAGDVQGPQLREQGNQINQFLYYANGVPTVGESIIANTKFLKSHGDLVKAFVKASVDSWIQTRAHPAEAAAAVVKQFPEAGTEGQMLDQIKVDLGLLCAAPGAKHLVEIPDPVWQKNQSLLTHYANLPKSANVKDYVNTKYVPASLPSC